jgi:hypothetical protein
MSLHESAGLVILGKRRVTAVFRESLQHLGRVQ